MSSEKQTLEILLRAKAEVDEAFGKLRASMKEAEHATEEFSSAAKGHMEGFHKALDVGKEHLEEHQKELAGNVGVLGEMASALGPVALGIAAVTGGIVESVEHFSHLSHEIQILKAETGFTSTGLQQMSFAADASGTSIEKAASMATKMDAAIEKGSPAFEKMGLDLNELKNSSPEEAFREVSEALVQIPDQIERVALARQVFGKSGAAALEFAENLNHLSNVAQEAGIVMGDDDLHAASSLAGGFKELEAFAEGLSNQFAAGILEGSDLKSTVEGLAPLVKSLGEAFRFAGETTSFLFKLTPPGWMYEIGKLELGKLAELKTAALGNDFTNYNTKGTEAQVKRLMGGDAGHGGADEEGPLFDIESYDKDIKKNEELAAAIEKARERIKERRNEEKEAAREAKEESRERDAAIAAEVAAQERANHAFEAGKKGLDALRVEGIAKYNEALGASVSELEKEKAAIEAVYQKTLDKADADTDASLAVYGKTTATKEDVEALMAERAQIIATATATRDLSLANAELKQIKEDGKKAESDLDARLAQDYADKKKQHDDDLKSIETEIEAAHAMEQFGQTVQNGAELLQRFGVSGANAFVQILGGLGAGIAAAGQFNAAIAEAKKLALDGKSTTAAYGQAALAGAGTAAGIYQRGSVVGGAATGLSMGLEMGKGNPLIAAGGAAVGAALGFFGGKHNDKKAIEELTNQIKQEFVGGVEEAKRHARELGLDLDKAFDSHKPKDVQSAMDQLNKAMGDQKTRLDGLGQAASGLAQRTSGFIKELESNFTMVDAAGNKTSVTLEEVHKHTEDWKKGIAAARGETLLMNAASAEQEKEFDRLGLYASATFGGMVAETGDVVGALRNLDPILNDLSMAEQEMGFTGSETLNTLLKWHDIVGVNKGVGDSIQGLNSMIDGLGKAGIHTQELFRAFGGDAVTVFDQLVAGGATSNDALGIMQPTLQKLWEQENDFGYAADDATQHLIDQGVQQGLVGDKMRDVNEKILKTLQHIDDAIRGIPDKTATVTLKTKYTTEGTPPPGSPFKGGPAVEPGNNNGPTYHDEPNAEGEHYYASGGRVPWRPGGQPSRVAEYQTENILSDNQLRDVIGRGAEMLGGASAGQGQAQPVIHAHFYLDGQAFKDLIVGTTNDGLRSGAIR